MSVRLRTRFNFENQWKDLDETGMAVVPSGTTLNRTSQIPATDNNKMREEGICDVGLITASHAVASYGDVLLLWVTMVNLHNLET
jgi:hypothetical protein